MHIGDNLDNVVHLYIKRAECLVIITCTVLPIAIEIGHTSTTEASGNVGAVDIKVTVIPPGITLINI